METILGGDKPKTAEDIAHEKAESLDWRRFETLLHICYEHYIHNDTKPNLANFTRMVFNIGNDFTGETFAEIPSKGRDRLICEVIRDAIKHERKREVAGKQLVSSAQTFRTLVIGLIKMAHDKENKPLDKSKNGAAEFVAGLLFKYGITNNGEKYAASTINDW